MMEVSSRRPSRPTRSIPPPPIELPPDPHPDNATSYSASPAQTFVTPPGSPSENHPAIDSPVSEEPPPLPSKDTDARSATAQSATQSTELTPIRAHYLKKELINLQFRGELRALTIVPPNNISTISYLGPPFAPPPKGAPRLELPFLRFMFRQFVLSFPFLTSAPKDFFPEKLQPFMASMLSRNLSSASPLDNTPEDTEQVARFKLLAKIERNFAMLLTSGTRLVEHEEVVRLTQRDLDRLEHLARKRANKERKLKDLFEINVVCIRTVVEKKRVRSKAHEEFIIRTRRRHQPDVFVSRRYGDFKTLADELRKAHPGEEVPPPPAKDRTYVNVSVSPLPSAPISPPSPYSHNDLAMGSPAMSSIPNNPNSNHGPRPSMSRQSRPMPGHFDNLSVDSLQSQYSGPGSPASPTIGVQLPSATLQASRLAREKNRLTLRSYLHTLLSTEVFASSPVLRSFLLSGPTRLTEEEREDTRRREEADRMREDGRKRFAKEIKDRVEGLRDAVRSVKGELLGKDGLTHVFATIKHTPEIKDLPDNYKAVVEWARISLASTVFHHFVAADNASESFASMKRIHGMMPYFMLRATLKISNPIAMIRSVLDLFLAQPFGSRSLLQRMFTGSLMDEVRALEEDIESVRAKVEDAVMCEKVRLFIYAPREIQAIYKADAAAEGVHVLTVVLRSGDTPQLNRAQLQRVQRANTAHKAYLEMHPDPDDEGPEDDDAWLYEDLMLLGKLYSRLLDREQLIALIFEGTTADLLKDIITIFYSPLAQVYRAASIADSLSDLQNFINDLIRTVESTEELSQQDPAKTVQAFIDLIHRHEQAFYTFVHKVHSKGEGLFDRLMRWIEQFLTLMRDGLGEPISLEFLLPYTGEEREAILREVDEIARYHYLLKVAHEAKLRKRFGRTQGQSDADAEDEEASALVDGIVHDLSFGDLVSGDAAELAAQETDEDSSSEEDESEDESGSSEGSSASDSTSEESEESRDTRQTTPTPSLMRSHTIGSPGGDARQQRSAQAKLSLDLSTPTRQLTDSLQSPRRGPASAVSSRSSTPFSPSTSSSGSMLSKHQPPVHTSTSTRNTPNAAHANTNGRQRLSAKSPLPVKKAKAKPIGPKSPELQHIPKLLPVFVEMMRPLLQPQR